MHTDFKEYLLAESYLESIIKDKPYRLNVGVPSKETISFLDGLLQFIAKGEDSYFKRYADRLLESFNDTEFDYEKKCQSKPSLAVDVIREKSKMYIQDEHIIFQIVDDSAREIWRIAQIQTNQYQNLWIHRWISLFVLSRIGFLQFEENLQGKS